VKQAGQIKFGVESHPETILFSPDGQSLVTGSADGFVEVWDFDNCRLRKDLEYQAKDDLMMHDGEPILCSSFSRDSEYLATGSRDGQVKVWKISTGICLRKFPKAHTQGITAVSFSRDGTQILTASFDNTTRLHGLKSGKTLKEFRGHTSYVNTAIYTRDNSKVITASSDGSVIVFDAKTTEQINTLVPPPPPHLSSTIKYTVNAAYLAPRPPSQVGDNDDPQIFVCTRTNTILLMNLQGQVIKSFSSGKRDKGDFVAMVPSPKGEWLYACAEDHRLYCFSTATGTLEQTLKVAEKEVIGLTHHPSRNVVAVYSTDGTLAFLKP